MTNKKSTKRALLSSVVAIVLCFVMLLGSTYAWFTDSVTSANNIITSGSLDVKLEYSTDGETWTEVDADTQVFEKDAHWEPGYTQAVAFRVSNVGNLAVKYQLSTNVYSETGSVNVYGDEFLLSDYLEVYTGEPVAAEGTISEILMSMILGDREAALGKGTYMEQSDFGKNIGGNDDLLPGESHIMYLAITMPADVGNEANAATDAVAPKITFGVTLVATQTTYESDGFGKDYDANAPWVGGIDTSWYNTTDTAFTLTTAEQLAGLAQLVNGGNTFSGKTVSLGADLDLNNLQWTPIGSSSATPFRGTFSGKGHTVSNLYVTGTTGVGLFGYVYVGSSIEGLTIDGAYVSGNDYVGAVVGKGYMSADGVANCTVKNATIIATPYFDAAEGVYDGGAKAGAVVGYVSNACVTGNTAKNCTISAYRDLGGIVGMVDGENRSVTVSGNTVDETVVLSYVGVTATYDKGKTPNQNMGDIVGRSNNATVENNSGEATKNTAPNFEVATLEELNTALSVGGNIALTTDITISGDEMTTGVALIPVGIAVLKDSVLNLNGYDITLEYEGSAAVIYAYNAELTINGEGTVGKVGDNGFVIWVRNSNDVKGEGVINIEGDVTVSADGGETTLLYADSNEYGNKDGSCDFYASINVYSGTFIKETSSSNYQDYMNVKNFGAGRITLFGGTYNFNPDWTIRTEGDAKDDAKYITVAEGHTIKEENGLFTVVTE